MGKYSKRGSSDFDALVDSDLKLLKEKLLKSPFQSSIEAIVLTGGYGRGEGSVFVQEGKEVPFNDYDLMVIVKPISSFSLRLQRAALNRFEESIQKDFSIPVDLYLHTRRSLLNQAPSLMYYEMQKQSTVIYGDCRIVEKSVPNWTLEQIPLIEASRLLFNRGATLLDPSGKDVMKSIVALGDALLISLGTYSIYSDKKRELIMKTSLFPEIQKEYLEALEAKELLNEQDLDRFYCKREKVIEMLISLFLWIESKRLSISFSSIEDYKQAIHGINSPFSLKNALLHLWYFGLTKVEFHHPRETLFPDLLTHLKNREPSEKFKQLQERFG